MQANIDNEFQSKFLNEAKEINRVIKVSRFAGIALTFVSCFSLLGFTFGNSERFLPKTSVCFDPVKVNEPFREDGYKRFCEPKKIRTMLTPLYNYWMTYDYEFSTKTRLIKHHDSNIDSTKLGIGFSTVLAFASAGLFGYSGKLKKEQKNLLYRNHQVVLSTNDINANAAIEYHNQMVQQKLASEPNEAQVILSTKDWQLEVSRREALIAEQMLLKDKHLKEREDLALGRNTMTVQKMSDIKYPDVPNLPIFKWEWFRDKSSEEYIPNIRIVGAPGTGKSTLISWLLQNYLQGESKVVTPKADKNPLLWGDLTVIGRPERWKDIYEQLKWLQDERKLRNARIMEGIEPQLTNILFDEWKGILDEVQETDNRHGNDETFKIDAKHIIRTTVRQGRAAMLRLILNAQSRNAIPFGFGGEADLMEGFVTVFLGRHAIDECENWVYGKKAYTKEQQDQVYDFMVKQGNRAAFFDTPFGQYLAVVPNIQFS